MKYNRITRCARFLMYKLGISMTIPASAINSVPIRECGEPLVNLRELPTVFFDDVLQNRQEVLVRKTVFEKLEKAVHSLPEGCHLKFHSAFRPRTEQVRLWERKCQEMREQFPSISEEEMALRTKRVVADPRFGFGGHQTGGAIDVTLCDDNGIDYDMGSEIGGYGSQIHTFSTEVSEEIHQNRMLLLSVLTKVGFVNYPKEWWHFCYGDRMWAAYTNKKCAVYGEVK